MLALSLAVVPPVTKVLYVSCGLSVKLVEVGTPGLVPAELYTVSLTEVVEGVLTLPPALSLTEVAEGVPGVPFTVSVNMNVPGESSISLGCNDSLTSSVMGPLTTYVSDGVSFKDYARITCYVIRVSQVRAQR
jgi:hypothetical protein